ncbi:hypothetical protein [Catenovulum adriaticum]|uniref:DUF2059 domain-containing protein n=1 Tax=Catenovulum adriaticum TaxID=2984846 RepID=A0ABY7APW8_9ALTE|nr:hypothetical protein [Catenovulum sp. TS8]WAJ70354.1 hypothetical protein OLW01_00620 [Catenovulum sp. TS8]
MLKTIRTISLFAALLPAIVLAQANKTELINQIIEQSGMESSLDSLPAQFQAQALQQKPYAKDPQAVETVMQILTDNFDKHSIQQAMVATFDKNMSLSELQQVKTWLDSELGSEIATAEAQASNPAIMQEVQVFAASFQTNPPAQDRITAIQNFVQKSKLVESTLNMVEQIMRSTLTSIEQFNEHPNTDKVDQTVNKVKGMMEQMLWQQMILMSHYTYQDLSVAEINQYTDFLTSDTGKKYLNTSISGVTAAISQLMNKSMPQIKQAAQAHKQES